MPVAVDHEVDPKPKTFVLCFDGTGNKFSGTEADSNILKIYRMLDKEIGDVYHYYQPGIGTYVTSDTLEHTSVTDRISSWCAKARDSAIGTSFAHHVMGGYKFLMRYYSPGDDIYLFGFSRGAYTARFLSEMLDWVGLLSAGNEELTRFAWKTFSKWQARRGGPDPEAKKQEKELYAFVTAFRETFSRPVKRIRFLGLFDTVNSVPRFENAWMQRSKFPYSVRSSAKVIRHAVAIDERRAKFRQDLMSGTKTAKKEPSHHFWKHHHHHHHHHDEQKPQPANEEIHESEKPNGKAPETRIPDIQVEPPSSPLWPKMQSVLKPQNSQQSGLSLASHTMHPSLDDVRGRAYSIAGPMDTGSLDDLSQEQVRSRPTSRPREPATDKKQDIEEVWFPGCHADIGGGWPKRESESWPLSHAPLVWMVHEAQLAGLKFDRYKMAKLNCRPLTSQELAETNTETNTDRQTHKDPFLSAVHESGTRGFIHDCLQLGAGLPASSVLTWNTMEYLPFRRMDLGPDGLWKPIRWPLPRGETRDMPADARVHRTAISRMHEDAKYRPGNLIVGGGGRGLRTAPEAAGIGAWLVWGNEGDVVRETYVRKGLDGGLSGQVCS